MNRVVVVSGGGTGIGRAIARTFASEGDHVVILGRRGSILAATAEQLNGEQAGSSGDVRWQQADLTDPAEVERAIAAIVADVGGTIHVLINNAGGVNRGIPGNTLAEIAEQFERDFRTNVLTAVLLTRAVAPYMARPGGRIVNFSSIAAFRGGGDSYSVAKAALHGWTYTLAAEFGAQGITVNAIAPGYVADTEFFGDAMTPERQQRLIGQTLAGRAGQPDDIANAVQFLASEGAAYISGEILQVNGGALFGR